MAARRSCADRLHQIQRDAGLTQKELKQAVRDVARPREVKLPTFHEKTSKAEKERRKYEVGGKLRKRMIAHWYLEKYLKPKYAQEIYMRFPKFKDLVNYAYEQAMALVQLSTFETERDVPPEEMIPVTPMDELDIPETQWKEFSHYCKSHPLKGPQDVFKRRKKFKKYRYKKRGKYYSRKRMRMYDPLFAMTVVNEKEMIKNLNRISKENELRVQKFHEMLDSLVSDRSVGSSILEKFDKQTKEIMSRQRARVKQFMRERGLKPTPISFSIDDGPSTIYDGSD